jgi:hypothetical protein
MLPCLLQLFREDARGPRKSSIKVARERKAIGGGLRRRCAVRRRLGATFEIPSVISAWRPLQVGHPFPPSHSPNTLSARGLLCSIAADCHDRARRERRCIVIPFLIQQYAAISASTEQYRASYRAYFLITAKSLFAAPFQRGGRERESNPTRTGWRPFPDLKSGRPTGDDSLPLLDASDWSWVRQPTSSAPARPNRLPTSANTRLSYICKAKVASGRFSATAQKRRSPVHLFSHPSRARAGAVALMMAPAARRAA